MHTTVIIEYATYLIDLAKKHNFPENIYNYYRIAELNRHQKLIPWLQQLSEELRKSGALYLLEVPKPMVISIP